MEKHQAHIISCHRMKKVQDHNNQPVEEHLLSKSLGEAEPPSQPQPNAGVFFLERLSHKDSNL